MYIFFLYFFPSSSLNVRKLKTLIYDLSFSQFLKIYILAISMTSCYSYMCPAPSDQQEATSEA